MKKTGRPKLEFNAAALEQLAALNCTQPEIAAFFRVSLSSVEKRLHDDSEFRDAFERGRALGLLSLRRKQIELANRGNATMLVWLGKQLLGQKDKVEHLGSGPGGSIDLNVNSPRELLRRRLAGIAARAAEGSDPQRVDGSPDPSA